MLGLSWNASRPVNCWPYGKFFAKLLQWIKLFEILDSGKIKTIKNSNSIEKIESLKFENVGFKYYSKSKKMT